MTFSTRFTGLALVLASIAACGTGADFGPTATRTEADAGMQQSNPPQQQPPMTTCGAGTTNCSGTCRDLTNDRSNCGACGRACASGQLCMNSVCRTVEMPVTCGSGLSNCNGSCRDTRLDDANCGACGVVCPMGQTCTAGTCMGSAPTPPPAPTCSPTACPAHTNANATCVANACSYRCFESYGDCDGSAGNGCETALTTDANCGACGHVCSGGSHCNAGVCVTTPAPAARYLRARFGSAAWVCTWDLNADPASAMFCSPTAGGELYVNIVGSYWPGDHVRVGVALDNPTSAASVRWIANDLSNLGLTARQVGFSVLQLEGSGGVQNLLDVAQSCVDVCHPSYSRGWRETKVTVVARAGAPACPATCDAR